MTTSTTDSAVITNVYRVFIESTPERVWEAITDPEWNDRYGYRAKAHYELRAGGVFVMLAPDDPAATRRGAAEDVALEVEVVLAEVNGSETYLHVGREDRPLVVLEDGVHSFQIGQAVTVYLKPERLFAFNDDGRLAAAPDRPVASPRREGHGIHR